ncbi:MAG: hypothetical protein CMJ75_03040 [Planctomycetaceae bacterium]|nr:hypothetical protein [Planctomycetaceae bacterium]
MEATGESMERLARRYSWKTRLLGFALERGMRLLARTLDFQVAHYDSTTDPALPGYVGPCIYAFWHEYLFFPTITWGHCDVTALASRHRDAAVVSCASELLGFEIVRGSTARGGATALRKLARSGVVLSVAMASDGPRGPRRQMAPGAIFLASQLRSPLIPVGFGYERPWRVSSWDRFAVPRPGSRVRGIMGPRIDVPPELSREQLDIYCQRVNNVINILTIEAESWAASRTRRPGQIRFPRPRRTHASRSEDDGQCERQQSEGSLRAA